MINVQASQLARTAMINPMFIIQLPHVPTARSSTPAVEGVGTAASSCWVINPKGNTDNRTYTMRQPTKPMIVALPTSSWPGARSERTTAPSIPIKAQSVTSMVPLSEHRAHLNVHCPPPACRRSRNRTYRYENENHNNDKHEQRNEFADRTYGIDHGSLLCPAQYHKIE